MRLTSPLRSLRSKTASVAPEVGTAADCLPILFSNNPAVSELEKDVQEGERTVADGGEGGGRGGEEGRQLGPGARDAQKVKTPVKLCS